MAKVRVVRTLIYEGEEEWVEATLMANYVHDSLPFATLKGTITSKTEPATPVSEKK